MQQTAPARRQAIKRPRGALSLPCASTLRFPAGGGLGATWPGLRPPPLAHRSVPARSGVPARTLTHTHPDPHAPRGDSPGPARDPQTRSRTPSGARTLRTRPTLRPIPRPTGRAAPPTFPDSGDAGSALRVALGGGRRPEQQQPPPPPPPPQLEPGLGQQAGRRIWAETVTSGGPRATVASSPAAEISARGGGVKHLTSPRPSQPFTPRVGGRCTPPPTHTHSVNLRRWLSLNSKGRTQAAGHKTDLWTSVMGGRPCPFSEPQIHSPPPHERAGLEVEES